MRHILLDESVPVGLAKSLISSDCRVSHVVEIGLEGMSDRQLLNLATGLGVDVLVTCDQHMIDQQDLRDIAFGFIVICTNSWPIIRSRAAEVVEAVTQLRPGARALILQHAHRTSSTQRSR